MTFVPKQQLQLKMLELYDGKANELTADGTIARLLKPTPVTRRLLWLSELNSCFNCMFALHLKVNKPEVPDLNIER